jgi:hypothetical protein
MPIDRLHSARFRWPLALLVHGLWLVGCQSDPVVQEERCQLKPGLTTEELAGCGCFSTSTQSRYRITEGPESDAEHAESVTILTFLCPRGTPGFTRVLVVNGAASAVEQ